MMLFARAVIVGLCCLSTLAVAQGPGAVCDPATSRQAIASLTDFIDIPRDKRSPIHEQAFAGVPLTEEDAAEAEKQLWQDYAQRIRLERADEMESRVITMGELQMPFFYKVFGDKPLGQRSLYISMHGGGGAPARVNDRQWENQKQLYSLDEGVYLVPRAPTNTWDLWHQSHIDRFFDRLITNMIVFAGVDPNRVYLMGYSAGGDGVFQLAPRMSDRFAAAAMMAGHPNETSPRGLRNLPFTLHMGGRDQAYQRNEKAREWQKRLAELHEADKDGYVHHVVIHEDKGHWMDREDAVALGWMAQYTRRRYPERIVWVQDDVTHSRNYWLACDSPQPRAEVQADRDGQTITVGEGAKSPWSVLLADAMLDLDQPVTVMQGDRVVYQGTPPRTIANLSRTLEERGDPGYMFSARVTPPEPPK
ncbi:MAG: dienelactone hydrolase family protein [Planctomycetales bacterium]|nr:dienelactone hydrolase family protein [Planctomycetales bacterium]